MHILAVQSSLSSKYLVLDTVFLIPTHHIVVATDCTHISRAPPASAVSEPMTTRIQRVGGPPSVGMTPHFGWPALASADVSVYHVANEPPLGRLPVYPRAQQHLSSAPQREGRHSSRSAHQLWPMAAMASTCIMLACMVCRACGACMLPSLCGLSSWVDVCMARSGCVKMMVSHLGDQQGHQLMRRCIARLQLRPEWPRVGHGSGIGDGSTKADPHPYPCPTRPITPTGYPYPCRSPPDSDPYVSWEHRWLDKPDTFSRYLCAAKWKLNEARKRIKGTIEWWHQFQPELIPPDKVKIEAA